MKTLFPDIAPPRPALPARLPRGFSYHRDFLSLAEERELLAQLALLELKASQYHEYTALRKTASFSLGYGAASGRLLERPSAPEFLRDLAAKVAHFVGRDPRAFPAALVTEYPPGAPIGWHRDAPPFAVIYGVSLGADCSFRLRPHVDGGGTANRPAVRIDSSELRAATLKLTAERRSLYVMAGESRSNWQHSIAPVKETRWSVTLRTL